MGTLSSLLSGSDRAQCGIRNIGVLQTTVAELVTVKEHQRKLQIALKE